MIILYSTYFIFAAAALSWLSLMIWMTSRSYFSTKIIEISYPVIAAMLFSAWLARDWYFNNPIIDGLITSNVSFLQMDNRPIELITFFLDEFPVSPEGPQYLNLLIDTFHVPNPSKEYWLKIYELDFLVELADIFTPANKYEGIYKDYKDREFDAIPIENILSGPNDFTQSATPFEKGMWLKRTLYLPKGTKVSRIISGDQVQIGLTNSFFEATFFLTVTGPNDIKMPRNPLFDWIMKNENISEMKLLQTNLRADIKSETFSAMSDDQQFYRSLPEDLKSRLAKIFSFESMRVRLEKKRLQNGHI